MSEEERLTSIPALKEEGNSLYKAGDHEGASKKYSEALGRLEQLMLRYSASQWESKMGQMCRQLFLLHTFMQCLQ